MATKSEAFPSRFLKPVDLNGQPCILEMKEVKREPVKFNGKEETKHVLYFAGTGKALILNATNWDSIVDITGEDDSDNWAPHIIEVYPTTTDVRGIETDCIRVRAPQQGDMLAAAKSPKLPPAPAEAKRGPLDDDIPY